MQGEYFSAFTCRVPLEQMKVGSRGEERGTEDEGSAARGEEEMG